MPAMSAAITAAAPQTQAATRGSALLKLSLTELKLLSRERVRAALPVAAPLLTMAAGRWRSDWPQPDSSAGSRFLCGGRR